jgi:glutaredoxin 3
MADAAMASGSGSGIDRRLQAFTLFVPRIRVYTTEWCGLCVRAKWLLDARGLAYREIALDDDPGFRQRVYDLGQQWTVPLVTIDDEPIGGYRELAALDRSGLLAERLAA